MTLDADIKDRIKSDFQDSEALTAIEELTASKNSGRVARCIVIASMGSLQKLRELIELAEADFRDAILAGEYDSCMRPIRDLCVSFLIASPADFWISEAARTLYGRGFILTALKSIPATVGPFNFTCDQSEGWAIFSNGNDAIIIKKSNRQWSVTADGDICKYGLDRTFDYEERFRIQMDYYLSLRQC